MTSSTSSESNKIQYPDRWIQKTFTSKGITAELLRPELENETISAADYKLAQQFLPIPWGTFRLTFAVLGAGVVGAVGYLRKPRWNKSWLLSGMVAGTAPGILYGSLKQAKGLLWFQMSLENPEGMEQALGNVHARLGGTQPFEINLRWARDKLNAGKNGKLPNIAAHDVASEQGDWVEPSITLRQEQQAPGAKKPSPVTDAVEATGRWQDIRKANSVGVQDSSWDRLRQTHERTRANKGLNSEDTIDQSGRTVEDTSFNPMVDDERARQQAEFNALLEQERKLGEPGQTPKNIDSMSSS